MNTDKNIQSRRALLNLGVRSLAGVGLLGSLEEAVQAATSPASATGASGGRVVDRALVCVYLFGGEDGSNLPAIPELQALEAAGALRLLRNAPSAVPGGVVPSTPGEIVAQRYGSLRFLPNGFATPEWAARLAGLGSVDGSGAFTFRNGMSLVSLDGRAHEGSQFENSSLREAMNTNGSLRTAFPDSSLGLQLEDVSRLLQASGKLGLKRPVFLCTAGGFDSGVRSSRTLKLRYRELGQALVAFYEATVEMGMERQVTTYTDAEFAVAANGGTRGARIVLGGAAPIAEARNYHATLARWQGVANGDFQELFPAISGFEVLA